MLKTKILTLSVHEDNAFDGIEIALHPDLFATSVITNSNDLKDIHDSNQNSNGSRYETSNPPKSLSEAANNNPNYKNESSNGSTIVNSSISSSQLEAGGLIEIRVWDKKGNEMRENSANGNNFQSSISSQPRIPFLFSNQQHHATNQIQQHSFPSPAQPSLMPSPSLSSSKLNTLTEPSLPFVSPNLVSNLDSDTPLELSRTPKSRPSLPFGVELADKAIKNSPSPNHYRRGILSSSPRSVRPSKNDDSVRSNNGEDTSSYQLRVSFVMRVSQKSLAAIKNTARIQISLRRQVADLYNLSSFDKVTVTKIPKSMESDIVQSASADFVTVTIKDQFISRGEMFHIQNYLLGRWMYEGERIVLPTGFKAHAREIRHGDKIVRSGIVTKNTKITFRSRSSRIIWLVQISTEMWDYTSPYESENETTESETNGDGPRMGENNAGGTCEIYFDKFVGFMHQIFEKWNELEVTHSLTIIFFSRTFINSARMGTRISPDSGAGTNDTSSIKVDFDGRLYQDHYKMVVENETRTDWESLIYKVKKEFLKYPHEVGWNVSNPDYERVPSIAAQGNILEAINVTLNLLQLHFMDRDLSRTGNSIVIVSPGQGVFEVNKGLAGITKQRMMDNGIGSDMLSLNLPPMHIAPFFLYKSPEIGMEGNHGFDDWKTYFEVPHWMHLSFISYDEEGRETSPSFIHKPRMANDESSSQTRKQVSLGANGFLIHPKGKNDSAKTKKTSDNLNPNFATIGNGHRSKLQQRNLVTGRAFDDILEACRPRNRGETIARMPSALIAVLHDTSRKVHSARPSKFLLSGRDSNSDALSVSSSSSTSGIGRSHRFVNAGKTTGSPYLIGYSPQIDVNDIDSLDSPLMTRSSQDSFHLKDWRTINFDDCIAEKPHPVKIASLHTLAERIPGSQKSSDQSENSSPCSSFNSTYSYLLGKSPGDRKRGIYLSSSMQRSSGINVLQIQPSLSIEATPYIMSRNNERGLSILDSKRHHSAESLYSTHDDDEVSVKSAGYSSKDIKESIRAERRVMLVGNEASKSIATVDDLKSLMMQYDSNIFQSHFNPENTPKQSASQNGSSNTISAMESQSNTLRRGTKKSQDNLNGSSHGRRKGIQTKKSTNSLKQGGIEAALVQFNKSNSNSGHHNKAGIRRIMSSRMFPAGKGKYSSMAGPSSGGSGGPFVGMSSSLGRNCPPASPPLKALSGALHINSPDKFHLMPPGHLTYLIPPGGTTTELGMISSTGWGNHMVVGSAQSYDNPHRKAIQGGLLSNIGEQVSNEGRSQANKPVFDGTTKQTHSSIHHHSHHGYPIRSPHQHTKRSKGKLKKKHSKHNPIPTHGKEAHQSRQKPWVLNPFRQQDEEDVLAKRTHNRRRWSHVFPPGEVEFKRHAGPNWKSLCQPAVLPLTVDYHPAQKELSDERKYQFNHYEIRLDAMDRSYYKDHSELLLELVTQRLIQDFQAVPQEIVQASNQGTQTKKEKRSSMNERNLDSNKMMKKRQSFFHSQSENMSSLSMENTHTLSMGHRIHQISYNSSTDAIEVIQYHAKFAQNDSSNIQAYDYMTWAPSIGKFLPAMQKFMKYSNTILWNKYDNLISGDPEKRLTEETRFRRLVFTIIPDQFGNDVNIEQQYVQKFQRLLDYILKLQQKDVFENDIDIISSTTPEESRKKKQSKSNDLHSFVRCTIPLMKSKREKYEWMDILLDSSFDTKKSYHILVHWLVANGSKVEAHIQLLYRRCTQYGLNLVSVPQYSMSSTIYLHPFVRPPIIHVRDKEASTEICSALVNQFNFIRDGEYWVDSKDVEGYSDFDFTRKKKWIRDPNTTSYIHNSGLIFVRALKDNKGWILFIIFVNRRIAKDDTQLQTAHDIYHAIKKFIDEVTCS